MDDRQVRLQQVAQIAVALEAQTGCPAQLLIAQWALESKWGAKPAGNANFFGIKKADRHVKCCTVTTREVVNGKSMYRKYYLRHMWEANLARLHTSDPDLFDTGCQTAIS